MSIFVKSFSFMLIAELEQGARERGDWRAQCKALWKKLNNVHVDAGGGGLEEMFGSVPAAVWVLVLVAGALFAYQQMNAGQGAAAGVGGVVGSIGASPAVRPFASGGNRLGGSPNDSAAGKVLSDDAREARLRRFAEPSATTAGGN